jgi:hypothetical protein
VDRKTRADMETKMMAFVNGYRGISGVKGRERNATYDKPFSPGLNPWFSTKTKGNDSNQIYNSPVH